MRQHVKEEIVESARIHGRAAEFRRAFESVAVLVREEWPTLDGALLDATEGDLERVTSLVAAHVDRTKVAARRQLLELLDVALESEQASTAGPKNGEAAHSDAAHERTRSNGVADKPEPKSARADLQVDEVIAAIRRLETFAAGEAKRVSSKMVPVAEAKVRQNLWVSLIMALGFGMIVGLWLNGGRKQR